MGLFVALETDPQGLESAKLVLCLGLRLSTEEHTELIPK